MKKISRTVRAKKHVAAAVTAAQAENIPECNVNAVFGCNRIIPNTNVTPIAKATTAIVILVAVLRH